MGRMYRRMMGVMRTLARLRRMTKHTTEATVKQCVASRARF